MLRTGATVVMALALGAGAAHAHGRFPRTVSVAFDGAEPDLFVVGTTFGLLVTDDGGASLRWICSEALPYDDDLLDPRLVIVDGRWLATSHGGLRVSLDGGCSWAAADPVLDGVWTPDVVLGSDGSVWASTWRPEGGADLYLSRDGGASFEAVGVPVAGATLRGLAVSGDTIHAMGYRFPATGTETALFTSIDGGAGWAEHPLPVVEPPLYLLGVAADPMVVLVREDGPLDRLHRSPDGGATWTVVLEAAAQLEDLAVLPDGRVMVTAREAGAFVSVDASATSFVPLAEAPRMACVESTPGGSVFACGANWDPDRFAVGSSATGVDDYAPVFRFEDIAGPVACADATPEQQLCGERWVAVQTALGIEPPAPPEEEEEDPIMGGGGCGCGIASGLVILLPLGFGRRRRA